MMVRFRNSGVLTDMVARAVASDEMLWRDGARLLGVSVRTLASFVQQVGGAPG